MGDRERLVRNFADDTTDQIAAIALANNMEEGEVVDINGHEYDEEQLRAIAAPRQVLSADFASRDAELLEASAGYPAERAPLFHMGLDTAPAPAPTGFGSFGSGPPSPIRSASRSSGSMTDVRGAPPPNSAARSTAQWLLELAGRSPGSPADRSQPASQDPMLSQADIAGAAALFEIRIGSKVPEVADILANIEGLIDSPRPTALTELNAYVDSASRSVSRSVSAAPTPRGQGQVPLLGQLVAVNGAADAQLDSGILDELLRDDEDLENIDEDGGAGAVIPSPIPRSGSATPSAMAPAVGVPPSPRRIRARIAALAAALPGVEEEEDEEEEGAGAVIPSPIPRSGSATPSAMAPAAGVPPTPRRIRARIDALAAVLPGVEEEEGRELEESLVQEQVQENARRRPVRVAAAAAREAREAAQIQVAAERLRMREEKAAREEVRRRNAEDAAERLRAQTVALAEGRVIAQAMTPAVRRAEDLASISASDSQVLHLLGRGQLLRVYKNPAVAKQCWICGLRIYQGPDTENGNQYEHVQPFKTALFESLLYVPGSTLGQNGPGYVIARQCIGEYSHNKCNGGGATHLFSRTGKGDIALKMGGRNGNWDDLVPNMAAIRMMLIGADGTPQDFDRSVWSVMTRDQRDFYDNKPALFCRAREMIIYCRVAQVCFMVRLCVDWNKHAIAKGYALAKTAAGGETKQDLLTYFKNTSALNPCPGPYADRYREGRFFMQLNDGSGFGASLGMRSCDDAFIRATHEEFNASYGAAVTDIKIAADGTTEESVIAILNEATVIARELALAREGAGGAAAGLVIRNADDAIRANAPPPPARPMGPLLEDLPPPEDPHPDLGGSRRKKVKGVSGASTRQQQRRQQKKLRTQKKRRVTTEIVPYQP